MSRDPAGSTGDTSCTGAAVRGGGSGVAETRFSTGHLSHVVGARLTDDREIAMKIRQSVARLAACAQVQQVEPACPGLR
jgi:hypothetical protein